MRSPLLTTIPRWLTAFGLLVAIFTFGGSLSATATHLLGGEVRYRSLGQTGTTPGRPFRYEVSVSVFINCDRSGNPQTNPFFSNVPFGRAGIGLRVFDAADGSQIFDDNNPSGTDFPGNDPGPGGTDADIFVQPGLFPFGRTSISDIAPPTPVGCNITAGCVRLVTYVNTIDLPATGDGYYFVYTDLTRNQSATNLLNGQGQDQLLYTFVPDPLLVNRSPIFTDTAVALLCVGDTATLINNASDPDGDRLTYEFYAPYTSGGLTAGNFTPPPTPVTYATGFSGTAPFGAGGFAFINATTGLTRYVVPNAGNYVVGVKVNEYRRINGADQLISSVVREIQLAVRTCPNLPPPSLQLSSGGNTSITIEEGASTSFTATATVVTGNPVRLTATSPLLDGPGGANATFNNNPGTAPNVPVVFNATTTLAGNFQFTAACGSAGVYNVNIAARDQLGCPIKTTSIPYIITVLPPPGPTAISGAQTACPNTVVTYTATGAPASTTGYRWTVTGGVIQGTTTGATVSVRWTTVGTGTISAAAISARGCASVPLPLAVEVFASVTATLSGLNPAYCLSTTGGATLTGTPGGGTFSITGTGGTTNLVGNVFTPRVAGTFQVTYSFSNPTSCSATSAPFTVVVNALPSVLFTVPAAVCSSDAPITLTGTVNGATVTTGFTIDGVAASVFNPAVLGPGPHVVALTGTGVGGCTATVTSTVTVNASPVVLLTGLQPSYCQNAPAVPLTATANGVPISGANAVFTIDGTTATQLNPVVLAVGFHIVRVQGTGPSGCRNTDSARVEIKALPVLAITGLQAGYCRDAAPVTLTGTVDGVVGGTFTIDGLPATVFNPATLSVGPHTVVFAGIGINTCTTTLSFTVTVNPLPVVRIVAPTATSFCLNAPAVTLTGNAPGQFFIDVNPAAVTSFLPSALGVGPHVIRFTRTIAATGCTNDTTLTITILPLPALAITSLQAAYCRDAPPVPLTGTVDGVAGGSFTIDGQPATVLTPSSLTPGVHVVIFTGTGTNTCTTTDTASVLINALPTVAITGLNRAYCQGAPAVPLAGTVNGLPGPITFTVNGTAATSFNPSILVPGVYTVVATGTLSATGCRNTATQTVTINALPTVAITGLNPAYCVSAAAVPLTSVITGGVGTVTYTINGNPATSFNPATLGAGTYTVVATATVTATTCQNTATQTVVINALPTVAITGLNPAYCAGAAAVPLTATLNGLPAGAAVTFTINGLPATSFNPGTLAPGTYTVVATGTDGNTCVGTITQIVVINALPTVAITGLNPAYCLDAPAVPLTATVNGATGTVTFTIDGTAATTFTPATLGVGTHTVVALGTDGNTCQNTTTRTVIVNALPTVAITGLSPAYCIGAPVVPLTGTVNGATGTVTFTVDGLPATSFNPATLAVGSHIVVATGTDGNTCRNTVTQTVTINALPTVAIIGLNPAYCQGDAAVTLGGTVTPSGAIIFTVNGNPATVFDPATLAPGTYTVVATGTDPNTCVGTATQLVTINALPTVAINSPQTAYCVNAASVPIVAVTTGGPGGVLTFTVDGVDNPGEFNPALLGVGTHTVVATITIAPTGCLNRDTLVVTVNPLPTVVFTGLSATYCQGDPGVPLTGTVNGAAGTVTFTIDGNPATSFDPSTLAPGVHTVVITGTDGNTCQSTATQTVTINARPTALAPLGPPSVCPGLTGVPYSVSGATNQQFTWTVVGGTVATGQGTASITVDWDAANPNASISVVTADPSTTCRSLPATLPVTVNQVLQTQTPTGTTSVCVSGDLQTFSIPTPSPGSTYTWALTGTAAGTIFSQGASTIRIRFTQAGTATLVVTETSNTPLANCFGTSAPLAVTVLAAPDTTLAIQSSAAAICSGESVTYTFPNTPGSTYQWYYGNAPVAGATGNTFVFTSAGNSSGNVPIGVLETNYAGCVGQIITTPLLVNPVPLAPNYPSGQPNICPQNLQGQTFSVATVTGSTDVLTWTVTGGTITSGQGTPTVTIDFDGLTAPTLSVLATSPAGCVSPPTTAYLILDISAPSLQLATVAEAVPTQINLNLEGLNAQSGTQLVVQRRPSGSGAFQQVGTVTSPALTFTDPSADPNATAYDYRVDLTNACGTVLQSVEHTTVRVVATGTEASGDVTLTWNAYQGQPVTSYEVLRKNNAGGYDVVGTVPAGTLTYTATGIGRQGFNQTFRIRAVLAATAAVSFSNETQVSFQNAVQTYNIFTPNGDNVNDRFVIDNAALYPNNELAVFNRWGREVYRRKNYDNSWDGGELPSGTYYYLFTANGQTYKGWVEIVK